MTTALPVRPFASPAARLAVIVALEIEADRMLGSAFDEREFRAERGPVLQELRRDRDHPTWRLMEAVETTGGRVSGVKVTPLRVKGSEKDLYSPTRNTCTFIPSASSAPLK